MSHNKIIDGDRPSAHGAVLGEALALIADIGEGDGPKMERCLTCAFRKGTVPNQSAGTGSLALNCILRIDKDEFACHHGMMKDGTPRHICAGYDAALKAPFDKVREVMTAFANRLNDMHDGDADEIRDAFDRWLLETDPDGNLDVYQVARAYAARP